MEKEPTAVDKVKGEQKKIDKMLMMKLNNFVKFEPFLKRYSRKIKLAEEVATTNWARQHSNKLILFGIKKEHPMIVKGSLIKKTKFYLKGLDREGDGLRNLSSGKKKRGAPSLKERTQFLEIECEDGELYHIASGVKGWLIELNDRFLDDPNIIFEDPLESSFIGIIDCSREKKFEFEDDCE